MGDFYKKVIDNPAARYVLANTVNPIVSFVKNETKDFVTRNGTAGAGALGPRPWRRANSTDPIIGPGDEIHDIVAGGQFGLPVHNRVILWVNDADLPDGTDLSEYVIVIDDAIVTLNKTKNIIRTYLPGYKGSIKEHMYDDDFTINISFSIASDGPMRYDTNTIIKLMKNLQWPDEIEISNEYLNECFDITKISITDFELKQSERFSNIIDVVINGISFAGFLPIAY